MATDIDDHVDHLPVTRPPKPTTAPLCSPEINAQLNVTPEKKDLWGKYTRKQQKPSVYCHKNDRNIQNNCLSVPKINSTILVSKKLKELSQSRFDTSLVVKQKLEKSAKLRLDIAERASEALNYNLKDAKYTGLVSLDVSVSELGLQQRKIFKDRKVTKNQEEPDIMTFMSDDFQFERASLLCNCSEGNIDPKLSIPSTDNVFKLYDHIECWKR